MRPNPFYAQGFSGGLNTRDSAYEVEQNQARDLLNVLGNVHGAARKREGLTTCATLAGPATSLLPIDVTPVKHMLAQANNEWYMVRPGGTVTTVTGTVKPTPGKPWACIQTQELDGQGPVYLSNGFDAPQSWSGGGTLQPWTAETGVLPNGRYLKHFGERIWVAGMDVYGAVEDPGSTVVFSEVDSLGPSRNWPAQNVIEFDPNDGDKITGLGTAGPYLLVFKTRKVYVVYDKDTGANRRLSGDTGCVAPRSIVETPDGTYFLSLDRGVFVTDGLNLKLISDVVRPTIDAITPVQREHAAGAFHRNHYYLSVSLNSTSAPDTTLDFDTTLGAWWKHSFAARQFAVWTPGSEQIMYAAPPAARVDRCLTPGVFTDNGAGFAAYWAGAWESPSYFRRRIIQTFDYRKRLRGLRLDGMGKVTLSLAKDFNPTMTAIKTFDFTTAETLFGGAGLFGGGGTFGDPQYIQQGRAFSMGHARAFSFQWGSDTTSTVGWELENYVKLMADRSD